MDGVLKLLLYSNRVSVGEEINMLKTITLGSCVSVQGTFVKSLTDGKILVRVGQKLFAGFPIGGRAI